MGRTLGGRYELLEKIGDGGMAVVYKGRDKLLNRFVAVKILKPEYTKDVKFIDSFRRESQSAASLSHPNIVSIYDVGREGNIHYIVMELIEGRVLSDVIREEGPLRPRDAVEIAKQVALALGSAHKNQIIHRDVKPHNILLMEDGTAKITDFGIARAVNSSTIMGGGTGTIMGSVHYFSPEQARGAYVDEKSDIYSLGIVLYEMVTGQVPFDGENPVEVALKHINEEMTPPSKLSPGLPKDLEEIILKATNKYQINRYKSAEEMYEALDKARLSDFLTYGKDRAAAGSGAPSGFTEIMELVNGDKKKPVTEKSDWEKELFGEDQPSGGEAKSAETTDKKEHKEKKEPEKESGTKGGAKSGSKGTGKRHAKPREKMDPKKLGVIAAAVLLGLLAAILLLHLLGGSGNEAFEVPSLEGKTLEEATATLEEMGLKIKVDQQLNSADVEAGCVLSQTPSAGMHVKKGYVVNVNLSLGVQPDTVPDVVGKNKENAVFLLKTYDYAVGDIIEEYNNEVAADIVFRQIPAAGEEAELGSKVTLYISKGKEKKTVQVPDLRGKDSEDAAAALKELKLELGTSSFASSNEYAENMIMEQSVAPQTEVEEGTVINVTVSTGPDIVGPINIPITIRYDAAENDVFRLTVVVSDSSGVQTVINQEQRLKENEKETITLNGEGMATVTILFDSVVVQSYTLNFSTGEIF